MEEIRRLSFENSSRVQVGGRGLPEDLGDAVIRVVSIGALDHNMCCGEIQTLISSLFIFCGEILPLISTLIFIFY